MAVLNHRLRKLLGELPWWVARLGPAGRGRAFGVLTLWLAWERFALWRARLQAIRPGSILLYRPARYAGTPTTLHDGTVVAPGHWIVELHFDNRSLLRWSCAPGWHPWTTYLLLSDDLDAFAQLALDGELGSAVALYGVSYLAAPSRRLGCEFRPLPRTWGSRLLHYYLVGLAAAYHPEGWRGANYLRDRAWPGELWLSVSALAARTNSGPAAARSEPVLPGSA